MFNAKYFKYIMLFWMALLLSIVMSLTMTYFNAGFIPFPGILLTVLQGLLVSYIAGLIVPIVKISNGFAASLKLKQGSLPFHMCSIMVLAAYFTIIMTFAFTALAIGFPPNFWHVIIRSLPIAFIAGYIAGFALSPVAKAISLKMCKNTIC
ncbi:MAG: DUF2798 domain-containing protein [Oscillospiraceae bacterium]|jgi:hypothetical protein|nr:DUF2798 domain-containing protein [Oscillospiraceae bacterium]